MTHNPTHPAGGAGTVKALQWKFFPQAFPPCWCAPTPFGDCVVEEENAGDAPTYAARGVRMNVVARTEGLPEAKSAAQADYEARILSALSPTPPVPEPEAEGEAGAVKPLEWQEARVSDRWERFTAETIIGRYEALEWSDGTFGGSCPVEDRDESNVEFSAMSIDEAKAMCWQHYEARILPALAPVPEPEAEGEAVARAIYEAMGYDFASRTILVGGVPYGAWGLAIKCAERVSAYARTPSSEAEIADLRAKLDRMRQALEEGVRICKRYCTPYGRAGSQPTYDESYVHKVGAELAQALSLAGEEKTGASDV